MCFGTAKSRFTTRTKALWRVCPSPPPKGWGKAFRSSLRPLGGFLLPQKLRFMRARECEVWRGDISWKSVSSGCGKDQKERERERERDVAMKVSNSSSVRANQVPISAPI